MKIHTPVEATVRSIFCSHCEDRFIPGPANQKFCSEECASKAEGIEPAPFKDILCSGVIGSIAELFVAARLMQMGYEVHRALSGSSRSDLIAVKNDCAYRFEVRSARRKKGLVMYPKQKIRSENLVLFFHTDESCMFIPENPVPFAGKI